MLVSDFNKLSKDEMINYFIVKIKEKYNIIPLAIIHNAKIFGVLKAVRNYTDNDIVLDKEIEFINGKKIVVWIE